MLLSWPNGQEKMDAPNLLKRCQCKLRYSSSSKAISCWIVTGAASHLIIVSQRNSILLSTLLIMPLKVMYLGRLSPFSDPLWMFLEEQPTRSRISLHPSKTHLLIGSRTCFTIHPQINQPKNITSWWKMLSLRQISKSRFLLDSMQLRSTKLTTWIFCCLVSLSTTNRSRKNTLLFRMRRARNIYPKIMRLLDSQSSSTTENLWIWSRLLFVNPNLKLKSSTRCILETRSKTAGRKYLWRKSHRWCVLMRNTTIYMCDSAPQENCHRSYHVRISTAELWPIYLYIANQSKCSSSRPKLLSFAAHLAYLPKVSWFVFF